MRRPDEKPAEPPPAGEGRTCWCNVGEPADGPDPGCPQHGERAGEGRTPDIRAKLRVEMIAAGVPSAHVDRLLDLAAALGRAARVDREGRTPREVERIALKLDEAANMLARGDDLDGLPEALRDLAGSLRELLSSAPEAEGARGELRWKLSLLADCEDDARVDTLRTIARRALELLDLTAPAPEARTARDALLRTWGAVVDAHTALGRGDRLIATTAGPMTPLDLLVAVLSGERVDKLRPPAPVDRGDDDGIA